MDQRDGEPGAPTELQRTLVALGVFLRFGLHVRDLDRLPVDDGTPCNVSTHKRYRELSDRSWEGYLPMVRDEAQAIAKQLKDRRVIRIAQARGRLDQRIEYFLHVKGRPADDLQNIGGGR